MQNFRLSSYQQRRNQFGERDKSKFILNQANDENKNEEEELLNNSFKKQSKCNNNLKYSFQKHLQK